jgi:hypothetical protein
MGRRDRSAFPISREISDCRRSPSASCSHTQTPRSHNVSTGMCRIEHGPLMLLYRFPDSTPVRNESAISSVLRLKLVCMFFQNFGVVRKYLTRRNAVSVVIGVCSAAIHSMRVRGTPLPVDLPENASRQSGRAVQDRQRFYTAARLESSRARSRSALTPADRLRRPG